VRVAMKLVDRRAERSMLDRIAVRAAQNRALVLCGELGAGKTVSLQSLIGRVTLGLLAQVAEQRPLVSVVDDEQWLDPASAQVLGFVARRLVATSWAWCCCPRASSDQVALPQISVDGIRRVCRGGAAARRRTPRFCGGVAKRRKRY
jgi:hypothetical protein